jgi:hypothetical protein
MSAALVAIFSLKLGFVSAMGIVCGWQPMPDGSPRYECVVQLEPEQVNSLKHGGSIPLSVEVPDHIRPISRIRITVGQGDVPRQLLTTERNTLSASAKKSREGIVETQFTTNTSPTSNGYGIQQAVNQQVAPVNEYISNTQDAFARSLQNGGQAVRDAVNQTTQDILPPDPGRSISNAADRASQQLGTNLRNVGETVSEDIRQMFGTETAAGGTEILPPGSSNGANGRQSQQILPAETGTANSGRRRLDQPINSSQAGNWQSSAPSGTNSTASTNSATSPRGVFNAPWPEIETPQQTPAGNPNNGAQLGDRYGSPSASSSSSGSILPQNAGLATADTRNGQSAMEQTSNSAGPSFPPFTPSAGTEQTSITPTPTQPQVSNSPEIRREMLAQPANAEIQGANGLPIGQQPVTNAQTASTQTPPSASSFGWDTKPQSQPTDNPLASPTAGTPTGPVFPLLLSWVLLSGSGAGNLYLFWSYLDVRNKYHDLVDEASRRISGRRVRD